MTGYRFSGSRFKDSGFNPAAGLENSQFEQK
jgi:hypothetical protein